MRKILFLLLTLALVAGIKLIFFTSRVMVVESVLPDLQDTIDKVGTYLDSKQSPLSDDEVSLLVRQKHWKLLIGIMGIESQFCRRQISYNCFGIGGDSQYRHYNNFSEAIIDGNELIEWWQQKGRWLTIDDMNCHYVQPCNENWVRTVRGVMKKIELL